MGKNNDYNNERIDCDGANQVILNDLSIVGSAVWNLLQTKPAPWAQSPKAGLPGDPAYGTHSSHCTGRPGTPEMSLRRVNVGRPYELRGRTHLTLHPDSAPRPLLSPDKVSDCSLPQFPHLCNEDVKDTCLMSDCES